MTCKSRATLEEVQSQIQTVQAELDQLQAKADSEGLSAEETARFEELVAQLEQLKSEETQLAAEARYAAIRARDAEPSRPAPKVFASFKKETALMTHDEALKLWLKGRFERSSITQEDVYRARTAGFDILGNTLRFKRDLKTLNYKAKAFHNRTKLATVNAGAGQEWLYTTYSDKIVEYMSYESTFIGTLDVSSVSGHEHVVMKVDNTGLQSTYTVNELNPTIPEQNVLSANGTVKLFTITSGYHKATWEELQSSYINIPEVITKTNGQMHKRKIEDEVINGTGDGSDGVQGLLSVANEVGVADFNETSIRSLYRSIPLPYRAGVIFLASDDTAGQIYDAAVDDMGRSLFDRNIEDAVEFETLIGKKFFVSEYMPADTLLCFNPEHYRLVTGNVEEFKFFEEKFYPDSAWSGLMRFGGLWAGHPDAVQMISLGS